MNAYRAYYEAGYQTSAHNGLIPKAEGWIKIHPDYLCGRITDTATIDKEKGRKAWFNGYLDQGLSTGGESAINAIEIYRRLYPEQIWPETIFGQQYTLFYNQVTFNKSTGHHSEKWPKPSKVITVDANSFPEAIRKAWAKIVQDDTVLLEEVAFIGAHLPIREGSHQRKLLHRYSNATLYADAALQRLSNYRVQFSQYNPYQIEEIVKNEQEKLKAYTAIERELSNLYVDLYGRRPPERSDIFIVAYIEDVLRNMRPTQEKEGLEQIFNDYFEHENTDALMEYVHEGILPNQECCEDNTLISLWDLQDYFLRSVYGWSPHRALYNEILSAVQETVNGNTEKLDNLVKSHTDVRPLACFADQLLEAGAYEQVYAILAGLNTYNRQVDIKEENKLKFNHWMTQQVSMLPPIFC